MDTTSPTEYVRRSLALRLTAAQAAVVDAAKELVMLAAVDEAGCDAAAVALMRDADSRLRQVLFQVVPDAEAVVAKWELFAQRTAGTAQADGPGGEDVRAAESPVEAGGDGPSLPERVMALLEASEKKYFTPKWVFETFSRDPDPALAGYPDLRKAVQNAISRLAARGRVTKLVRGRYLVPSRADTPDPEDELVGDLAALLNERRGDTPRLMSHSAPNGASQKESNGSKLRPTALAREVA